jgi:hypothetical protein
VAETPIRGRWTIWFCPACAGSIKQSLGCPHDEDEFTGDPQAVEVVPVPDEAAIERGAKALIGVPGHPVGDRDDPALRAWALAVLRAALDPDARPETPEVPDG